MAYGLSSVMGACKPPCDAAVSERHAAGRRAMYRCQSEGAGQGWVAPSTGGAPELISGRTNHRSLDVVVRHNPGWKGGGEERTREEDGTWIVGGRKAIITGLSVGRPPGESITHEPGDRVARPMWIHHEEAAECEIGQRFGPNLPSGQLC